MVEEIPVSRVAIDAKGEASFPSIGSTKRKTLANGNAVDVTVSGMSMHERDMPIAKKIYLKYDLLNNGGWESEIGKKAQKEFFKQAWAWRKKQNAPVKQKVEAQAQPAQDSQPVYRRWQIAICNLSRGKFRQLNDLELKDAALLASLESDGDKSLGMFQKMIEELEHGE